MKWVLGSIGVVVCIVCGLLGLTAGINLNPTSTVQFVPNWGSLGDWVSGIGALLAVVTSLIVSRRSEENQRILQHDKIEVRQGTSSTYVVFQFTSLGFYPAKVRSVLLVGSDGRSIPMFGKRVGEDTVFPQRLEFKDDFQLEWPKEDLGLLLSEISFLEVESLEKLTIKVITTIDSFDFPLQKDVCDLLRSEAQVQGITIEH